MSVLNSISGAAYRATTKAIAELIAVVSPKAAARYIYERSLLGGYDAAKKKGGNQSWRPSNRSGTYENVSQAGTIRARARDLARNNGYIVGSIKKVMANTIGSNLLVNFSIKSDDSNLDRALNTELSQRFKNWARTASLDGKAFHDAIETVERGKFVDGEILINKIVIPNPDPMNPNPLRLQVLETDYLNPSNGAKGIEYDSYNKPSKFYLYKKFPDSTFTNMQPLGVSETIEIGADNMLFVYNSDRASTYRGVSELAPVAMGIYSIDQLEAAELNAIRSASAFGVLVTSPFSSEILSTMYNNDEGIELRNDDDPTTYIEPGAFHFLRPGEDAKAFKNDRPNSNLMPFIDELLYKNSSAIGVAAEEMTNNYSKVNYSSARQSSLVAKRLYLARREDARRKYLDDIVQEWLKYEVIFNNVPNLPAKKFLANPAKYLQFSFTFPGFDWVDPLKEIKATELEIQLGITSRQMVCESKNRTFEQVADQLASEKAYMEKLGIWGDDPTNLHVTTKSESVTKTE